jgi:7-cyano-7-deazaguanine synthase in queuosine biosynthesis
MLATLAVRFDDEIIFAAVRDEVSRDKNPAAFRKMSDTLSFMVGKPIEVYSNTWQYTKREAVEEYLRRGLDPELLLRTFSCYFPKNGKPCLDCECCFRRWHALSHNGIKAPDVSERIQVQYGQRKLQRIAEVE